MSDDIGSKRKTTDLLSAPIVHMFDVEVFEIIYLLNKVSQQMSRTD
jgi:hypothetical protein